MIDFLWFFLLWWGAWAVIIRLLCDGSNTPRRDLILYQLLAWAAPVALLAMWLWSIFRKVWK